MASGLEENHRNISELFFPRVTKNVKKIRHFDVVDDFSDHHFANTKESFIIEDATQKEIFKEWKILRNSLPDSIYVRVNSQRCNLMRAAIIGSSGTPYHDGLFFFDIFFPSGYPYTPPKVNYRSFGMRLNPNLYNNGDVCLSLLNTWRGKPNEQWVPGKSTILQVLVSILALVLNEKPVYNEPGHSKANVSEKFSRDYSEKVFILSCKSMVLVLKNPPDGFEDLVTLHFYDRSQVILTACKAYISGFRRVGHYNEDQAFLSEDDMILEVSWSFKFCMKKLYQDLAVALERIDPASGCFQGKLNKLVKKVENGNQVREDVDKLEEEKNMPFLKVKLRQGIRLAKELARQFYENILDLVVPFYLKIVDLSF